MKMMTLFRSFVVATLASTLLTACGSGLRTGGEMSASDADSATQVAIRQSWNGDFPVAELGRLPEGQRQTAVGYLTSREEFTAVWSAFKPDEPIPDVDFAQNMVVFARNTSFYNRTSIMQVALKNGVADVLAMETMSAMPIEQQVAFALAVIPRAGVKYLQVGENRVAVQ